MPWIVRRMAVRATQQAFTVSAAAVISNPDGKVLLLDHVIRPKSGWGLPGGFLNRGEQPAEGIRREIREEIGLELERLRLIRVRAVGTHLEILYTADSNGDAEIKSREIKDFGWFGPAEFPVRMNDAQKRLIKDVLNGEFEKSPPAY